MSFGTIPDNELGDLFEFWTPSEVKAYANNVAAGYVALGSDFRATPGILTANEKAAWDRLLADFYTFYHGIGFFGTLSMGTVRTSEDYAAQLRYWRTTYETKSRIKATGSVVDIPDEKHNAQSAQFMSVAKSVAWAVGLGAVAYLGVNVLKTGGAFARVIRG